MDNTSALEAVLSGMRSAAASERDKGTAFERLIRSYLTQDFLWREKFSDVWMWSDWPDRAGRGDAGIDLVAKDAETGELWAIQAKFYDPSYALQKGDIDSFFTESGKEPFSQRLIVSTTDHWSSKAEEALDGQQIPVTRLRLMDLADSTIDWSTYTADQTTPPKHFEPRSLRPHQKKALEDVVQGFAASDRGKLIMACGTGKTFTALRIAENLAKEGGRVLFLVPSISLLQQTLREWTNHSTVPLRSFAVCSDSKIGKKNEDISVHDLQYPATTNPSRLAEHAAETVPGKMTVVFSTYQSLPVVAEAQELGLPAFDLIICDEAHRTTGVTLADDDESNFVRIHDENFVKGAKRLYMTATPRIYSDDTKSKADDAGAAVASMDDEALFGPEFHRLGFGSAVEQDLLSDYKVLVLAVDESYIASAFQQQLSDENHELKLDDAAKIVGCWNGLAKRRMLQTAPDGSLLEEPESIDDPAPMKRAVAFAKTIKDSKRLTELFSEIVAHYTASSDDLELLQCETAHVDGNFNVLDRNARLDWLKETTPENTCRILSNARCLSEGVDVPALDAVLFLNPRNSTVDVVQSVGRVMRKHPDKKYGYVILPIGIPADMTPEEALADHQRYKVVWQVLQALRAHDDRFNAMINKIELNRAATDQIQIIGVGGGVDPEAGGDSSPTAVQTVFAFPHLEDWRDAILAKLVQKVGDRRYWESWASDIASIASRHIARISATLRESPGAREQFDGFLKGLQGNLNESVSEADAVEMLAQHLITKPVFDALFGDYAFSAKNPVSRAMQQMLTVLDEHALTKEADTLSGFYETVRMRAEGIETPEGKQRIITELYENFFKAAFPRTAEKLGIIYTPLEIVDFILSGADALLQREFGSRLADENVQILDPFTGTGTFIVRLIQSGIIPPEALPNKYKKELHANEVVLLAYYIAAINIEAAYHGVVGGPYEPFEGIVLTDTFQMFEHGDEDDLLVIPANNERVVRQKKAPIRVILGNPPYSARQVNQNDANQNLKYPTLDSRIGETYSATSKSRNRNSLYDSYIRAFRWASDRIRQQPNGGVVAFVTNGGFLNANNADGMRKALFGEFTSIYIFNLRGNQRTAGDKSLREGGKVFGSGSRSTVAITFLVYNPEVEQQCHLYYKDIGDYLSREEKLAIVAQSDLTAMDWQPIVPNEHGDWLDQRGTEYLEFMPLGSKDGSRDTTIFANYSRGIATSADAWVYNFSSNTLMNNVEKMARTYNRDLERLDEAVKKDPLNSREATAKNLIDRDPTHISWSQSLEASLAKGVRAEVDPNSLRLAWYRPFTLQNLYFNKMFNHAQYQIPKFFPSPRLENHGILVTGTGAAMDFTALAIGGIPDLAQFGGQTNAQFFPRHTYERQESGQSDLFSGDSNDPLIDGFVQVDNVSKAALETVSSRFNTELTSDDLFGYVYGILNHPQYRSQFGEETKKSLPRIPYVDSLDDFRAIAEIGSALYALHLNWDQAMEWPVVEHWRNSEARSYRVSKMAYGRAGKSADKSVIIFNSDLRLSSVPLEAQDFRLGSRSALDWVIERYQVRVDSNSGIVNDPNSGDVVEDDPRYILAVVCKVITVSMDTLAYTHRLPELRIAT